MDGKGLAQDAITCSSLISALAKGKQWSLALQVSSLTLTCLYLPSFLTLRPEPCGLTYVTLNCGL